jgi:hypothetical protein
MKEEQEKARREYARADAQRQQVAAEELAARRAEIVRLEMNSSTFVSNDPTSKPWQHYKCKYMIYWNGGIHSNSNPDSYCIRRICYE